MAQRILGLDIGSWSVKAIVVQTSLRKTAVTEFRSQTLATDDQGNLLPDALEDALTKLQAKLEVDTTIAGVPSIQVLLRELELPFADEKSVNQVLGFRLDGLLPRQVDTMTYDWHVLSKNADGALLLCAATDQTWMENWSKTLEKAKVLPRQLSLTMVSAENLSAYLGLKPAAGEDSETAVVLDLGHRSSQLSLIRQGRLITARALSRGGQQITQAISRKFQISLAQAQALKHEALDVGSPSGRAGMALPEGIQASALYQAGRTALEPLLRDIKLALDALPARPTRLILTGGTSELVGIEQALYQATGLMAERPSIPSELFAEDLKGDVALLNRRGLGALSLALENTIQHDSHRLNLQKGELGGADFSALRERAGWIAGFLAMLLVVFFARQYMRIQTLEAQEQQLAEALHAWVQEKLPEDAPPPDFPVIEQFRQVKGNLADPPESEAKNVYPQMTTFRMFYEVTRIQRQLNDRDEPPPPDPEADPADADEEPPRPPAERRQIQLSSFAADVKTDTSGAITISGHGFNIVTIEDFIKALREYPCFKNATRQETKRAAASNRPNWTEFTIKIDVKCGTSLDSGPSTANGSN